MSYCDTNVVTAFVSKDELRRNFGQEGVRRYHRISRFSSKTAESMLKNIKSCTINKKALFDDIGGHNASMGATLTSINLRNIKLTNIDGLEEGKKIYNKACSKTEINSKFYKKFCQENKLKENLNKNNLNDIRHFGTAIKLEEKEFFTDNKKDFQPLTKFTDVEVI